MLAVDPTQPAADFARMSDVLGRSISPHRFNMLMLTMFSGLALALAAIGVYGLTAYTVAQRTREMGIRVSLGASPRQLVRAPGTGSGCALQHGARSCGAIFRPLSRSLLFGISATDGLTIVVVIATMTAVVVAATYLPASRASRIDPILALRQE
jgi:ABC-type antimicrobial peptide transport system permease subunit